MAVDNDHPGAEVASRLAHDALELRTIVEAGRRCRGDDLRLRRCLRTHLVVDTVGEAQRERDLQRDEHEHEHVCERGEQAEAEAHRSSSGAAKRNPTPRTVWM